MFACEREGLGTRLEEGIWQHVSHDIVTGFHRARLYRAIHFIHTFNSESPVACV